MQFGLCAKPDQAARVKALGFDYLEPPVSFLAELSGEAFAAQREMIASAGILTPTFNVLFPGQIALLAPGAEQAVTDYLEKAFPRVKALGGELVVFGSGRSRFRPEDLPYGEAFRRLVGITRLIGRLAEKQGITIAVEPLNRGETNMINSVGEGACLVAAVNHPRVRLLADYYHVTKDGEPVEDLARLGGIAHCHVATIGDRRWPTGKDEKLSAFFSAMKRSGYAGRVSVEGGSEDWERDAEPCLRLLRRTWEEA